MNAHHLGYSISLALHGLFLALALTATTGLPHGALPKVLEFTLVTGSESRRPATPVINQVATVKSPPLAEVSQTAKIARQPPAPQKNIPEETTKPIPVTDTNLQQSPPQEPLAEHPPEPATALQAHAIPNPTTAPEPVAAADASQDNTSSQPAETPQKPGQTTATLSSGQILQDQYLAAHFHQIRAGIQHSLKYPRQARKMGWEGKVVVCFMIRRDGGIDNIRIVESSGFAALDKSALETIKKAAPFPLPPTQAELMVPVIYRLRNA